MRVIRSNEHSIYHQLLIEFAIHFLRVGAMQVAFVALYFNENLTNIFFFNKSHLQSYIYNSVLFSMPQFKTIYLKMNASPRFHVLFRLRSVRFTREIQFSRVVLLIMKRNRNDQHKNLLHGAWNEYEREYGEEWKAKLCSAVSLHAHLNLISNDIV